MRIEWKWLESVYGFSVELNGWKVVIERGEWDPNTPEWRHWERDWEEIKTRAQETRNTVSICLCINSLWLLWCLGVDGRRFCRVWTQWTSNFRFVNMHWNRQMPEYSFSLGIEGTFYQQIIQANKIKGCFSLDFLLKWTIQISFARIALSFRHNCSLRYGCDHINTNRSAPCMSTNDTIHLLPATEREHSRFSSIRKMPSHIIITDIIAANSHRKWHWSFWSISSFGCESILYVDADTGINESSMGNAFSARHNHFVWYNSQAFIYVWFA